MLKIISTVTIFIIFVSNLAEASCLFKTDFSVKSESDFNTFLKAGGEGTLLSYSGTFERNNGPHSFLLIKKFPEFKPNSLGFTFLRNKEIVDEMQKLVTDGVGILLIDHKDYPNLKAMVMPHWVSIPSNLRSCGILNSAQPTIVISASVHDYVYIHEMQHFKDYKTINDNLEATLTNAYEGTNLSKAEKLQIKLFILEQRAYVKQIQSFRNDREVRDYFYYFIDSNKRENIRTFDANAFAFMQSRFDFSAYSYYSQQLSNLLDKLKGTDFISYTGVKKAIEEYCLEDSEFGLPVVLPQHFD